MHLFSPECQYRKVWLYLQYNVNESCRLSFLFTEHPRHSYIFPKNGYFCRSYIHSLKTLFCGKICLLTSTFQNAVLIKIIFCMSSWGIIFGNGLRVERLILYQNYMVFPLVLSPPPSFEAVYCFICGRRIRMVAVAPYRMICHAPIQKSNNEIKCGQLYIGNLNAMCLNTHSTMDFVSDYGLKLPGNVCQKNETAIISSWTFSPVYQQSNCKVRSQFLKVFYGMKHLPPFKDHYQGKDRHHFNLLTKAGFEIRSFNRFPMLLSLPVHFALRKTAGDDFCAMTSSLELWDRKCQIYHQQPCKNRKSISPREER